MSVPIAIAPPFVEGTLIKRPVPLGLMAAVCDNSDDLHLFITELRWGDTRIHHAVVKIDGSVEGGREIVRGPWLLGPLAMRDEAGRIHAFVWNAEHVRHLWLDGSSWHEESLRALSAAADQRSIRFTMLGSRLAAAYVSNAVAPKQWGVGIIFVPFPVHYSPDKVVIAIQGSSASWVPVAVVDPRTNREPHSFRIAGDSGDQVHVVSEVTFGSLDYAAAHLTAEESASPGAVHELDAVEVEQTIVFGDSDLAVDPGSGRALVVNAIHLTFGKEVAARVIDGGTVGAPVQLATGDVQEVRAEALGANRFGVAIELGDRRLYRRLDERGVWSSPLELAAPPPESLLSSRPTHVGGRLPDEDLMSFPSAVAMCPSGSVSTVWYSRAERTFIVRRFGPGPANGQR